MKRILQIVGSMECGGIQTFIMNIYRVIDRSKIQFDFLVSTEKQEHFDAEILSMGGLIYHVPARRNGILQQRRALNRFFRKHREYQVIHQHVSSLSSIEAIKVAKRFGVPIRIIHSHSTNINKNSLISTFRKAFHDMNKFFIGKIATDYLACSETAAEWLYGGTLVSKEKRYSVIRNGVDVIKLSFSSENRTLIRKELGIDENTLLLGHVGRFHPVKNHVFLLNMFREVHKRNPAAVLMLVGDGPLRPEMEAKAKELRIADSIVFIGVRSDTSALFSAMDLFLFPSLYEGLGIVLNEAQASGLPCIVSNTVPKETNLTENYISLPINGPSDAKLWADEVERAAWNLPADREVVDQNDALAAYDVHKVAKELEAFYL